MLDARYLAVAAIIITFMVVTVGHVATYAGSFEVANLQWLGWPYAIAVDFAIVVCAWLTRWKTTRLLAWMGYIVFALASGAMNAAAIKPWLHDGFAWVYALFPTAAIVLLGLLARDTEEATERGKVRGILAKLGERIASKIASTQPELNKEMRNAQLSAQLGDMSTKPQTVDTSAQRVQTIDTSAQVPTFRNMSDHARWLHEQQPELTQAQVAAQVGCHRSQVSRAWRRNGDQNASHR